LAKEGTFFYLLFLILSKVLFLARAVFGATQNFYKQGISIQKATAHSCSILALEVGLLSASSNVLQAIFNLKDTTRHYKDATEEQDHLFAIYEAKVSAQIVR